MDVPVEKWGELNLPFIKQPRFNGLRFRILIYRSRPIALKTGIDNLRATALGLLPSTAERVGLNKILPVRSKLSDQPGGATRQGSQT